MRLNRTQLTKTMRVTVAVLTLLLLAVLWIARLVVALLSLGGGNSPRAPSTYYERRYSWERGGYSWQGRTDEME